MGGNGVEAFIPGGLSVITGIVGVTETGAVVVVLTTSDTVTLAGVFETFSVTVCVVVFAVRVFSHFNKALIVVEPVEAISPDAKYPTMTGTLFTPSCPRRSNLNNAAHPLPINIADNSFTEEFHT